MSGIDCFVFRNDCETKHSCFSKASLVDLNYWNKKVSEINFDAIGFEVSNHASTLSIGGNAKLVGAKLSASALEAELALGVSSEIGIVDDSVTVKVLGTGFGFGRKWSGCFLDVCVGFDFGKFLRGWWH